MDPEQEAGLWASHPTPARRAQHTAVSAAEVFPQRQPCIQRHPVDAGAHAGEIDRHAHQSVVEQQRHAGAVAEACGMEGVGEPGGELVDLGEGQG